MPTLEPLWRFVEIRPSHTAVMAEWTSVAGVHLSAARQLLMSAGRPATVYPNPRGGRPMRIVHHPDGTIVAVDGSDWQHRILLQPADVVLYQLDIRAVRKALCDALGGVNIVKSPLDHGAGCVQIGNWEPKKAATFSVYFLSCPTRAILRRQVIDLQQKCKHPGAILLTPTRVNWDDDLDALARAEKMLLVAVSEITEPGGAGLRQTAAWEEYLQAFCQMVKLTLPGNFRNRKPTPRRAELAAKVEAVKKVLAEHIRSAKDHVFASIDAGRGARLLRYLTKTELARLAGLEPYHITRCFQADPQLKQLHEIANDPEQLIRFGRR